MKKYLTFASIAFIASLLVSCGGNGYPKLEKKAAKKECSCYKATAEYTIKMQNYIQKNSHLTGEPEYQAVVDRMTTELGNLEQEAQVVCLEGWTRKLDESFDPGIKNAAMKSICPEIYYHINGESEFSHSAPEISEDEEGSSSSFDRPNSNKGEETSWDRSRTGASDEAATTKVERGAEKGYSRSETKMDMPKAREPQAADYGWKEEAAAESTESGWGAEDASDYGGWDAPAEGDSWDDYEYDWK